jgi:uncharacterized protein with NAD-binding domain and iron-sulfur cluster
MTIQSDLPAPIMNEARDDRRPRVIICGGGLAGLSAAKSLQDNGFTVELLEGRDILGGKVSSWRDSEGDWIESGLHVFFGAYEEIFKLMRELGIYENILWKDHALTYTLEDGERFAFRTANLPSPLHLVPAVFGQKYFTLRETLTLARAMPRIVFGNEKYYRQQDFITYEDWHLKNDISHKMLMITVQLWLDRQVTGIDIILFCPDGTIPVYADLGNTTPEYACGGRSRMEFVVAPARPIFGRDDQAIIDLVWRDVRRMFPQTAAGAHILKSSIVRIPQSVYWPKPGIDHLRPTQQSPIANLFLAGGYTIQRFYDSMEGAVSSGRMAARALAQSASESRHMWQ